MLSPDCLPPECPNLNLLLRYSSKSWLPLPTLPFTPYRYSRHYAFTTYFSYAIAGTKIMVSSPGNVVHCFDVADPTKQWRKLPSMCGGLSCPFHGRALVVDLDDPRDGTTEKLMFTYQLTRTKGWAIVAYRMFNDSIKLLKAFKPIPSLSADFAGRLPYSLVHLGGRCFSLVIGMESYAVGGDLDMEEVREREKTRLLVTTFKFHYLKCKADEGSTAHGSDYDSIRFDVRCLGSRILEYNCPEDPMDVTTSAKLLGCFVL